MMVSKEKEAGGSDQRELFDRGLSFLDAVWSTIYKMFIKPTY